MNQKRHIIFIAAAALFVSSGFAQSPSSETAAPAVAVDPIAPNAESAKPDKRLFGVLPNYRTVDASIPFSPLMARQKLSIARHDSFDWPTFGLAAVLTLAMPGKDVPKSYGTGVEAFANRYLRSSADQIIGNMLTEGFMPVLLRQDPRFVRRGSGTVWFRLRSSLTQIGIARNDSGHRAFNTSEFLGNAMATGISNAYSPNLNSWTHRSESLRCRFRSIHFPMS